MIQESLMGGGFCNITLNSDFGDYIEYFATPQKNDQEYIKISKGK